MSNPPPRPIVFKSFNAMKREFDLAVGEIQSTFNMLDAILKKNKSTRDEKIIGYLLGGFESGAAFFNKIAMGGFAGPITAAVTSVVTAVGGLLLLSNPLRRGLLVKNPDWTKLMDSSIEIRYGQSKQDVNLKEFCLDPEGTYREAFSVTDNNIFNKTEKEIPQESVEKILKAGEMAKSLDTKIKASLALTGLAAGSLFAKSIAIPISLGYTPDWAKNRPDNRQQIIKPNVEDLTGVPKSRLKPKNQK